MKTAVSSTGSWVDIISSVAFAPVATFTCVARDRKVYYYAKIRSYTVWVHVNEAFIRHVNVCPNAVL